MSAYLYQGCLRVPKSLVGSTLLEAMTVIREEDTPLFLFKNAGKEDLLVPRSYASMFGVSLEVPSAFRPSSALAEAPLVPLGGKPIWAHQMEAVKETEALCRKYSGSILCAPCGTGKTVMGLELARRFGQKTLVLVHKTFLMDQWEERIRTFLPQARIGRWQQDRQDSGENFDFVLGMVQSLVGQREYPQALFDSFGTVITDEVHRFAAPTWQSAITRFPARFRVGLTATPERRDGMHVVFFQHIGPIGYRLAGSPLKPRVFRVDTETVVPRKAYVFPWNNEVNISGLISYLADDLDRTKLIARRVADAAVKGRKNLVLSDRRGHLKVLEEEVRKLVSDDITFGYYVGGSSSKALKLASEADVILGTFPMAQEGLDIPGIDTLFLATPKTNIQQAVGRILREDPAKKEPIVVDFVDAKTPFCEVLFKSRFKRYTALGYADDGVPRVAPKK